MKRLKPCPFCGETPTHSNGNDEDGVCWVSCPGCLMHMGLSKTIKEAISAWNTRKEKP